MSEAILQTIRELKPWHHDMQVTPEVRVSQAFKPDEIERKNNGNVSFINARE